MPGIAPYPQLPSGVAQQYFGKPYRAYRTAALNLGQPNVFTRVPMDTAIYDADGCLNTGDFLVPYSGAYWVSFTLEIGLQNNPQLFLASAFLASSPGAGGGQEYVRGTRFTIRAGTAGDNFTSTGSGLVFATAGQAIQLQGFNNGGNVVPISPGSVTATINIQQTS